MSTGGPVPKNPPVGWVLLDAGYTIRWRRGDPVAVIFGGDQRDQHGMAGALDRIPVPPSGWTDLAEVRERGRQWLRQRGRSGVA